MAKRNKAIVLGRLAEDCKSELTAMMKDLEGSSSRALAETAPNTHWSQRFAASGKGSCRVA
ncbi:MAG: hypothetical protein WBQ86_07525, partial [Candidatus Binatus sp.]